LDIPGNPNSLMVWLCVFQPSTISSIAFPLNVQLKDCMIESTEGKLKDIDSP
jgi:hypothetical protein